MEAGKSRGNAPRGALGGPLTAVVATDGDEQCEDVVGRGIFAQEAIVALKDILSVGGLADDAVEQMPSLITEQNNIAFAAGIARWQGRKQHRVLSVAEEWVHAGADEFDGDLVALVEKFAYLTEKKVVAYSYGFGHICFN